MISVSFVKVIDGAPQPKSMHQRFEGSPASAVGTIPAESDGSTSRKLALARPI